MDRPETYVLDPVPETAEAEEALARRMQALAEEVLSIAKAQILVKFRFLDRALFELVPQPCQVTSLATDGKHLMYDPHDLLRRYRQDRSFAIRAMAHAVMHCIFRHMFVSAALHTEMWDLACDVACEAMVRELDLQALKEQPGYYERDAVIAQLQAAVTPLTAEKLYRHLEANPPDIVTAQKWRDLFTVDDHALWYEAVKPQQDPHSDEEKAEDAQSADSGGEDEQSQEGEGDGGKGEQQENPSGESRNDASAPSLTATQKEELEEMWKDISEHVQADLESFAKQHGFESGAMTQALRSLNREQYDYTAFLRKFATLHEVMRLSPDEFDYIFYTYGLSLYKDMPLIEPLEYREDKRIHDFVIAIDTSGSVQGATVQSFLQKTYTILKQEETFDRRFHIHIIQCDSDIQEDALITTQEEFDRYVQTMTLHGFGGTDFRPVFQYVEQLRHDHAFRDLRGLLYFTDGYGVYPSSPTDYTTAFVFLDDNDTGQHLVPSWAIRLVLENKDLEHA